MRSVALAALAALFAAPALGAQSPLPPQVDYSDFAPARGNWTWGPTSDGSSATFYDSTAHPQLIVHCSRASRQVTISKAASGAAPLMYVWTSALTRNIPASYNPATRLISVRIAVADPLLDAIAFSRGRFAVAVSGSPALVVPSWPEPARAVEDCRN